MSKPAYDNDLLAAMKEEDKYLQERDRGDRRVKIEKGQVWKVRFLPVHLGERGTWFARIAKHWHAKKPITCPVETGRDWGGDPDAYCPVCRASEELNESPDQKISRLGWDVRANSQWLTFCIVIERDGVEVEGNEMLMPYEFWHYSSTWEQLKQFWKARNRGGKDLNSVLDYNTGCDFNVTKAANRTSLDRDDPRPIFEPDDPNFKAYITKIEGAVKQPKVTIATDRELQIFADKIIEDSERQERGERGGPGPRSSYSRRSSVTDEDVAGRGDTDEGTTAPQRRPSAQPLRRRAQVDEGLDTPPDDDSNPELNPAPQSRRQAPPAEEPADDENPAPVTRRQSPLPAPRRTAPPADEAGGEEEATPPAARRRAAPEPETEPEDEPALPSRRTPPPMPKLPMGKRATPLGPADKINDDPEVMPEEQQDKAPPARQPVKTEAGPAEPPEDDEPTPPPTTRKLGTSIRDRVRATTQRES